MEQEQTVTTQVETPAPDAVPFWQPERGKNETREDYKARRAAGNQYAKNYIKRGTLFHDSLRAGTYVKN
jgi:hypothetical protein